MAIGNAISVKLDGSFKSVNATIKPTDFIDKDDETRSFLKRVGSIPGAGVFMATMSSVCFATGALCCRILANEVNSNQVVVARSCLQLIVYLVVCYFKRTPLYGVSGERFPLLLRSCFGFISLSGNYMAIQLIGLPDASAIVFSAPVFCVFFAYFLIGEPLRFNNLITLILVICGIILVCKPELVINHHKVQVIEDEDRLIGSIVALVACLANAMVFITLRKLQKTSSSVSIIWFSFISIILGSLLNAFFFDFRLPITQKGWLLLLLNGICGVFGQLLLTLSLKITEAGPISLARTFDIVMSFIYQITILHQEIELHTLIGAVLICFGVIITSVGIPVYNKIKSLLTKKDIEKEQPNA